jgi:nitroimidazol reductase NimA-like FMN-containing flavoprotein (pyridoxamine 5'-phosphate oxidase superfamily)
MRRADKKIDNPVLIDEILRQGRELSLAMIDGNRPYVIRMNYGYHDGSLYLHCAPQGKKLDCLGKNPAVCFEISEVLQRVDGEKACQWSTRFRSLVGRGSAHIISDRDEKIRGYDILMNHFGGPTGSYDDKNLAASLVIRIDIEELTGKQSH